MKSKRKILLAAFMLSAVMASAQKIEGGIMGGVSTGSVKISEIPNSFTNVIKGDNIVGIEGGFFMKLNAGPFYGKPELFLNYRSGKVDMENETGEATQSTLFKMSRLEIPLMFGLELFSPVAIELGPVYNRVLNVTETFESDRISIRKGGLGYRLGAVVELGRANLSIHYQGLKLGSSSSYSEATYDSPSELIFGIGIQLGK
ncbi:MAG TPA: outer membrane beta-barrel protein [Bacteroidia bacterium]|nr:outer membrane beta-barrel protein [Bacteroidia bacterium]